MRTTNFIFALSLLFLVLSVPNVNGVPNGACTSYWDGTAPFCAGHCPDDYTKLIVTHVAMAHVA
ncbi:hypothetical protein BC937DRAFT_91496 [Endogone sp. FLAS-F59071]|nr:hypothetical protein BC937DRAFT_91496 [Endogone sp. FLAS-F59071]|eukprot:RUS21771.1 hypothetical protein BC937DRAFT_91496 [Endogone sp. FLAS-F59071]